MVRILLEKQNTFQNTLTDTDTSNNQEDFASQDENKLNLYNFQAISIF